MTRLDRVVIVLAVLGVIGSLFVHLTYDPSNGRRPLPEAPPVAEAQPATPTIVSPAPAGRVRRPLPAATPADPLITAAVEDVPPGMLTIGTSFPVGNGVWLTARHVANASCRFIFIAIDGTLTPAQIRYLHPNADLAVLQTGPMTAPPLPISTTDVSEGESGYAFGYPGGALGGAEGKLMGRSRMELQGRLGGVGPVLTWAEVRRFPDSLDSLGGISGGPMLDADGHVVGIAVATSVRRGRDHTVAPEILREVETNVPLFAAAAAEKPVGEVTTADVSLGDVATDMAKDARIAKTYCVPVKN
jgi:S1-C subfamily serine protease